MRRFYHFCRRPRRACAPCSAPTSTRDLRAVRIPCCWPSCFAAGAQKRKEEKTRLRRCTTKTFLKKKTKLHDDPNGWEKTTPLEIHTSTPRRTAYLFIGKHYFGTWRRVGRRMRARAGERLRRFLSATCPFPHPPATRGATTSSAAAAATSAVW